MIHAENSFCATFAPALDAHDSRTSSAVAIPGFASTDSGRRDVSRATWRRCFTACLSSLSSATHMAVNRSVSERDTHQLVIVKLQRDLRFVQMPLLEVTTTWASFSPRFSTSFESFANFASSFSCNLGGSSFLIPLITDFHLETSVSVLATHPSLMRGRNAHIFAIFGDGTASHLNAFGLQTLGDVFVGKRMG